MYKKDINLNVAIIGNQCVGKSTLAKTIKNNRNSFTKDSHPTIGHEFYCIGKKHRQTGKPYNVSIIDNAGNERFISIWGAHMRNCDMIIAVISLEKDYDLQIDTMIKQINKASIKDYGKIMFVLNKADLIQNDLKKMEDVKGIKLMIYNELKIYGFKEIMVSFFTGDHVEELLELFYEMAEQIIDEEYPDGWDDGTIRIGQNLDSPREKSCNC